MAMFPNFMLHATKRIMFNQADRHFRTFMPKFMDDDACLTHFVQPADHHVCKRAYEMYIGPTHRPNPRYSIRLHSYNGRSYDVQVDPYDANGNIMYPATQSIEPPGPNDSEYVENYNNWCDFHEETQTAWATTFGIFYAFGESDRPLSQLKAVWPNFDVIWRLPGVHLDSQQREWVSKWDSIGKPRTIDYPVPDCMDHIETARATVMSMMLLQHDIPTNKPGGVAGVMLQPVEQVKLFPWYDWANSRNETFATDIVKSDWW